MNNRTRLFIGIAIVLAVFVIADLLNSKTLEMKERAIQYEKQLSRYQMLYQKRQMIEEVSQKVKEQFSLVEDKILKKDDPTEGFIILQRLIKGALDKTSLKLRTITPAEVIKEDKMVILPVRVTLEGSLKALERFLVNLYSEDILVGVRSILITKTGPSGALRTQMTIEAYLETKT